MSKFSGRTLTVGLVLACSALSGCAAAVRSDTYACQGDISRHANTPAMSPDRVCDDRPRSFSDPGPNYPDTGR